VALRNSAQQLPLCRDAALVNGEAIERRALSLAEDAARELPNLPLEEESLG
jgi:hypothetical protein